MAAPAPGAAMSLWRHRALLSPAFPDFPSVFAATSPTFLYAFVSGGRTDT